MKNLKVLFAAAVMFIAGGFANAQKFATVDVASIITNLPEMKKAEAQLEAYQKAKEAELKKEGDAFQAEVEKYQTVDGAKMTQEQRKAKEDELQKKQTEIQKKLVAAQQELAKKRDEAFGPIEAKIQAAIDKVAKANSWDFVMSANSDLFLYKNGPDATAAVKKELGLQ